jgi:type IV pilus assembly protein PilC
MSEFVVRVGTADGLVLQQRHRAANPEALRRELEGKGLHVFAMQAVRGRWGLARLWKRDRISPIEFLIFNQQFSTLLRAGIPVLQSLELLQRSQASPVFRQVLARVLEDVRSGVALSESFAAQGGLFPRLYCATLLAGEQSGELVPVLARYTEHSQVLEAVRRRVSSALTYPLVLILLSLGLITLLLTYVIPRFATFYIGFASELPLPTLLVLNTAAFFERNLVYMAGAVVLAFPFVRRWMRSERGSLVVDRLKLRLPFVGRILHLFAISQFTRSLGTLLGGGTPLVRALEVASATVTNRAIGVSVARVAPRVREGQALWSSLDATGYFPELSVAMVQVGEATGALEEMLFNAAQFYDESIEVRLARVVSLIEPAVLVAMGGVVSMLLLSVYYPMFTMIQHAN